MKSSRRVNVLFPFLILFLWKPAREREMHRRHICDMIARKINVHGFGKTFGRIEIQIRNYVFAWPSSLVEVSIIQKRIGNIYQPSSSSKAVLCADFHLLLRFFSVYRESCAFSQNEMYTKAIMIYHWNGDTTHFTVGSSIVQTLFSPPPLSSVISLTQVDRALIVLLP